MSVEKRLKELRIANDLSQKEMAEILGVSLSGYQNYEHGGRDIPTSVLARAMKKFGVDANWLFGEVHWYTCCEHRNLFGYILEARKLEP